MIFLLAIFAIFLRFYFLFKKGFDFDIDLYIKWGDAILRGGLFDLYSKPHNFVVNYPPLIPLLSSAWLALAKSIGISSGVSLKIFFKLLPTLIEAVLTIICATYIWRSQIKYKTALLSVILIQPALAFVSAAWGQTDVIFTLLILLGFMVQEKNSTFATFLLFLSLMAKPQALPAVVIYFLYLLFKKNWKNAFVQLAFFISLSWLAAELFRYFSGANLISIYINSSGYFKNISLNAFNIWWLIHGANSWNIQDNAAILLNPKNTGFILLILFEIPALIYLYHVRDDHSNVVNKKARDLPKVLLVLAYSYLIFFIFPTEIHERYLYPAVALLAIPAILDKRVFLIYIILTVTFFVNAFTVLQSVYPQFGSYIAGFGNLLIGDWTRLIALLNLIVVIYFATYFFNESAKKV